MRRLLPLLLLAACSSAPSPLLGTWSAPRTYLNDCGPSTAMVAAVDVTVTESTTGLLVAYPDCTIPASDDGEAGEADCPYLDGSVFHITGGQFSVDPPGAVLYATMGGCTLTIDEHWTRQP